VITNTGTVWKSTTHLVPERNRIIETIKDAFNADKVVVLGDSFQPTSFLFHLDQAVLFSSDSVACFTRIIENPAIENKQNTEEVEQIRGFLHEIRRELSTLGYKIVDIETSVENVKKSQFYVNGIHFTHRDTSQKVFLMPVFAGNNRFERELEQRNTGTFRSLGYKVKHVATPADSLNGGPHCLANILE
jgi:hypothetical protein